MKNIKGIICLLCALPFFFSGCVDKDEKKVELKVDKTTVAIGGTVTFIVMYDGLNVTADAKIKDETNGVDITGDSVKVNTPEACKFSATYNGQKSDEVTVTVTGTPKITLSVDTEVVYVGGDDAATFAVMYGEADVTKDAVITNITSGQALASGVNSFSSTTEGAFVFKAEYDGLVSGNLTVNVVPMPANPLSIKADKVRIKADGVDYTSFKVMYMHKDVTAKATIKNITENINLTENKFSYSGELKSVKFAAQYDGKTSNEITVGFGDFYKTVMFLRYTSIFCGPCAILSKNVKEAVAEYPDRLLQVSVHSDNMGKEPMTPESYGDITTTLSVSGLPTSYFELNTSTKVVGAGDTKGQLITKIKENQKNGADCGIAATSVISGNNAIVTIDVTAAKAGVYYMGAILVEDGITGYNQAGDDSGSGVKYMHDNTFRSMATGRITGLRLKNMIEGDTATRTYTFDLKDYKKENCRILCYVLSDKFGLMVTNVISCPLNGSVDYKFEK